MPYYVIGLVIVIIALNVALYLRKKNNYIKNNEEEIYENLTSFEEDEIIKMLSSFDDTLQPVKTSYIGHNQELTLLSQCKDYYEYLKKLRVPPFNKLYATVNNAIRRYEHLHEEIERYNYEFIKYEKSRCDQLLSDIDGKSLDDQQRTVVVTDEEHNLVLAGAGSGKTLTIAGKVKYLVKEKGIDPDNILLIAFTRKAAGEMTERISDRLGIPVTATTFHKLGLDIIKKASGKSQDVFDDMPGFITDFFENHVVENQRLIGELLTFFAYYLNIPTDMKSYSSLGEVYEHEKGYDFETIRSKYERSQYVDLEAERLKADKKTLYGETVKSLEEATIANFLFLNGVDYEYEYLYPYPSDEPSYKAYRPDFYLPEYDIYIEHFGTNKQGRLPWLSHIEEEKYLEGMRWKRAFHKKNKTKLLETYSYYASEGILIERLRDMLEKNGVSFHQRDYYEIFNSVYAKKSDKYFSEFKKLCATFITLFKSNGYKPDKLNDLFSNDPEKMSSFLAQRNQLFLSIIRPIIEAYESYLKENQAIDFSDMIIQATDYVNSGDYDKKYDYVIIDEYQDISVARYRLVKAILDKTNAHLLCVGDDWQSIYRFAGSDISLFTNFENYFGYTKTMRLEQTYRNSQQLIDNAQRFVLKNPAQLKKSLHSNKQIEYPISFWFYSSNPFTTLHKMINKMIEDFGPDSSILFLGRTSYDEEVLKESGLFEIRKTRDGSNYIYKESRQTPVSFLTVHKAKGLEADNAIILNFENSTLGFPNKISDDPVLRMVLSSEESFNYAEERRLFYVAVTRTRNRAFVLTNENKTSEFLTDFKPSNTVCYVGRGGKYENQVLCPRCKTGQLLVRQNEGSGEYFVGCSHYPRCDYSINDTSVLTLNKRCPSCGGFLLLRKGEYGSFWGCSNYPLCQYTLNPSRDRSEKKRCPECGGDLIVRKGKYGVFLGCSNYPDCKHTEKLSDNSIDNNRKSKIGFIQ